MPSRRFFDLSTWHLINWLYTPKACAQAQELRTNYADTRLHDRLMTVLEERLGHRLASEVEQAKIAARSRGEPRGIDLAASKRGLARDARRRRHGSSISRRCWSRWWPARTSACAGPALRRDALDAHLPDGWLVGPAAVPGGAARAAFAGVPLVEGDLFGGVAAGLAYAARSAGPRRGSDG